MGLSLCNYKVPRQKNQMSRPYKLYTHRGRVHRNYSCHDRGYDRGRENYRQRYYDINRKELRSLLDPNSEVMMVQEDYIEGQVIKHTGVTTNS